jgi:glycosyltransferase involved in cell wall biosynthesis
MKVAMILTDEREEFHQYEKPVPYFGPAPTALLEGLSNLSEIELHIVSCTKKSMSSPSKLADNVWFHLLHVKQSGWLRSGYSGCVLAIRRKLRDIRPDIVHGQGTERYCSLGAAFSGFPNIITIHGNMRPIARVTSANMFSYMWSAAKLEAFVLPRTDGVVCNSAYTESIVRPLARKTWRVPNALRLEFFRPPATTTATANRPVLLNVGTTSRYKRQLELLGLAKELHRQGLVFELRFIGASDQSDSYAAAFCRQVDAAKCAGFAQHLTPISLADLVAEMDAASALLHAPSEEAFGLVVAEALARNLKLFATNVGGIPDIAREVEGAELFRVEDDKCLHIAIAGWLQKGCPRPLFAAQEMKNRYHPNVIASRHLQIYREFLGTSPR